MGVCELVKGEGELENKNHVCRYWIVGMVSLLQRDRLYITFDTSLIHTTTIYSSESNDLLNINMQKLRLIIHVKTKHELSRATDHQSTKHIIVYKIR